MTLLTCLSSLLVLISLVAKGLGSEDEVRLVEDLFDKQGYNPLIRPVTNLSYIIHVEFGLAMVQLINVDEKNQILKTNVWLRMTWKDFQLHWEPSDYGGIQVIRIKPDNVWKPDIVLFNNADGKYEVSWEPNILIYSDGTVLWIPPAIYKSSCAINVMYFPFDQQICKMKFGSWTYDAKQVTLGWYEGRKSVDLSDYVYSGTWDVIDCPAHLHKFNETLKDFEGREFLKQQEQIYFNITIRRKTLFYTVNLIIPCVLISFLSVCVFYLPADAGEKMTLCISILLALVVFLLLVSKILPPTSLTIPLISKFLLFTFIMNIITIFITVVIINWNFRTPRTHRMPTWARYVFLNYLPRILLMKRPDHDQRWREGHHLKQQKQHQRPPNRATAEPRYNINARTELLELADMPNCRMGTASSMDKQDEGTPEGFRLTPEMHRTIEGVKFIYTHIKAEDDYHTVREDWKYIAMVIDRLQLYLFLGVTIGGTIGILINAPHIFEYIDQDTLVKGINEKTHLIT
ncbi:acetylcholine receptor subunit beta-like 1 isoform X2 [Lineus longissimus]|uniref:acetylcholine receptor subunit beta-like 1 isoform X2 n=1 Tax=Lineus longissimus TaxID=88925 RepID=UPI002B4D379C